MYRNWKNAAALGLAVLLGCMMPMSTMLAAEADAETVADSAADSDAVHGGEGSSDEGNASENETVMDEETASEEESLTDGETPSEEENVTDGETPSEEESATDGENAQEEESVTDAETPDDENTGGMQDAGVFSVPLAEPGTETKNAEDVREVNAPEISITRDGKNSACSLGGKITFEYVRNWGPQVVISVSQGDQNMSIFWYKDTVTDIEAEAKTEAEMDSLRWEEKTSPSENITLSQDGKYVIYAKVETDGGQKYYARSGGIVVDTKPPVIKGVEEGMTYQEGTMFQVEDANLDFVLVNENTATPENGNYKVAANGSSCVIRAKDKAGNETVCSITVSGTETPGPETPGDSNVISKSGEYTLKAGVKYHLAAGQWKVNGDKSVYTGDSDFYVTADGSYKFTK